MERFNRKEVNEIIKSTPINNDAEPISIDIARITKKVYEKLFADDYEQ